MAAPPGGLQEEALRRKERLKALRERTGTAARQNKDDGPPEAKQFRGTAEEAEEPKHNELKLRNYAPEDEELKARVVPQAKPASVEDKVKDQLEAAKPQPIIEEVDLANLAPRKPDWRAAERPRGGPGHCGGFSKARRERFGLRQPLKGPWRGCFPWTRGGSNPRTCDEALSVLSWVLAA
ncbi:coiled-coil domain-containing protein 12 isoform X2 [Paroedura picta]|uniref:coiled-coil domain-containing protein 12 isoform X2 n=1 Tax=Paroedura picta TaxID=143630 RepID=UPI00405731E6